MRIFAAIGIVMALAAGPVHAGEFEDGLKYYEGKDYANAIKAWSSAAAKGSVPAQFTLGYVYEKGEGVKQDYKEAMVWYQKAATQGYAAAQINLGSMYEKGQGVASDIKQAVSWYEKAAAQGLVEA